MYLIGVFIKTRQLFLNKNSSVSLCVCECVCVSVRERERVIYFAVSSLGVYFFTKTTTTVV